MEEMLQRYFAGELTPAEKEGLMDAVEKDAELRKEFCKMQNLKAITSLFPASGDTEKSTSRLLLWRKSNLRVFYRHFVGYAAAVLVAGFALWGLLQPLTRNIPEEPATYMMEVSTPSHRNKTFKLSDGTIVCLNASSVLRYPNKFSGEERRVILTGEAFFEVAQNEAMPFIVTTEQYDIRVLGTKFNVFAYKDHDVITSLVEGSLEVVKPAAEFPTVRIRPYESIAWGGEGWLRSTFSEPDFILWREGIYAFDNTPFKDIVDKLQLYYATSIVITNDELAQYRFSAKFRQDDGLESILKTMKKIYGFQMDKNRQTNTIIIE